MVKSGPRIITAIVIGALTIAGITGLSVAYIIKHKHPVRFSGQLRGFEGELFIG